MKNFIKSNIAAIVTVLTIFAGGSALAVYSNVGGDTVKSQQPSIIVVYDKEGNISLQKDTGNQAVTNNLQYIVPTDQELKAIHEKGMNSFKVINGKLTEVTPGQPKKYAVIYNPDGSLVSSFEKSGKITLQQSQAELEISDARYQEVQQKGKDKFRVVNGELSETFDNPNTNSDKGFKTIKDPYDGKEYIVITKPGPPAGQFPKQ